MAIFLKGLSEKFSSSRKSKCSLPTDEVWKKAFVLTFHYDPNYLYHSGLDSILLSRVLSVPVKCLWSFPLGPDSPSTTVLFTWLPTWIPTRFPHIYADSYNIGLCFFSRLPPPTLCHPSRWSESPGLSSLSHITNSHWLSILHKLMYMFPCYSFHSSHPLLPTHYTVSIGLFSMSSYPLLPYKWAHQYCLSRFYIYALICNICFSLF